MKNTNEQKNEPSKINLHQLKRNIEKLISCYENIASNEQMAYLQNFLNGIYIRLGQNYSAPNRNTFFEVPSNNINLLLEEASEEYFLNTPFSKQ